MSYMYTIKLNESCIFVDDNDDDGEMMMVVTKHLY